MNAIFIKEVSDTILNGKLLKFNFSNISDEEYILELNIGSRIIKNITKDCNKKNKLVIDEPRKFKWINNIILKITLNRFKKTIERIIKRNELVGYSVIYSNELKKNKRVKQYLDNILNKYSINEYLNLSTVKENVNKYIDEHLTNNGLKEENINLAFLVKDVENLDLELIEEFISKYREVNIFTINKVNKSFQNKIKKINDEYGSCIQVMDRTEKDLKRYNVNIFVDNSRAEYSKYKFNRKACFIDFTNKENDKFNKKYIKLEQKIREGFYYSNKVKEMYELYGKITVSNAIVD